MKKTTNTLVIEFENGKKLGSDVFQDFEPYDMAYELMGDLESKGMNPELEPVEDEQLYNIFVDGDIKFMILPK